MRTISIVLISTLCGIVIGKKIQTQKSESNLFENTDMVAIPINLLEMTRSQLKRIDPSNVIHLVSKKGKKPCALRAIPKVADQNLQFIFVKPKEQAEISKYINNKNKFSISLAHINPEKIFDYCDKYFRIRFGY